MIKINNKKYPSMIKQITIFFVIISLVFSLFISFFIINKFDNNIQSFYGNIGTGVGKYIISQIDNNKVSYYARTRVKDNYYFEIENKIKQTKKDFDLAMIYVLVPLDNGLIYIWDENDYFSQAFTLDSYDMYKTAILNAGSSYVELYDYKLNNKYSDDLNINPKYIDNKKFASILVPYISNNKEVEYYVGVEFNISSLNVWTFNFAIIELFIVIFVFFLQSLIIVIFIKHTVLSSFYNISQRLVEIEKTNKYRFHSFNDLYSDIIEINDIVKSLSNMIKRIEDFNNDMLKNLVDDTQANFAISTMRDFKSEDLFKPSLYYDKDERYKVCAYMKKIDKDNKDYYDIFDIDDNKVGFLVMESSEKSEAFFLTLDAISRYIKSKCILGQDIGNILTELSKFLHLSDWVGIYVDCLLLIIDFKKGSCEYVNAGYINSAIFKESEDLYKDLPFERENSLSAKEDPIYKVNNFNIESGDKILFYTSNLNDMLGIAKDDYESKEIVKFLNNHKNYDFNDIFEEFKTLINENNNANLNDMIFMFIEKK